MKHQNKNVIINPSSSLGWPVTLPFFPSAIFLCFPDSECWIKLALPSIVYFLSTSQYQHLNFSLSTYCAQSPTKSLLASFSPKHPVCQLIDFFLHFGQTFCQRGNLWNQNFPFQCLSRSLLSNANTSWINIATKEVHSTLLVYLIWILHFLCIGLFSPIITIYNQIGFNVKNDYRSRQNPPKSILARIFGLRQGFKDKSCPGQEIIEKRTRFQSCMKAKGMCISLYSKHVICVFFNQYVLCTIYKV